MKKFIVVLIIVSIALIPGTRYTGKPSFTAFDVSKANMDNVLIDYADVFNLNGIQYSSDFKEKDIREAIDKLLPSGSEYIDQKYFVADNLNRNEKRKIIDIADYNGDKNLDILVLAGERNKSQTAEMFSYENGRLRSQSIVELDSSGFHENIISGKLVDGRKALFIDSGLGAHSMLTEIVVYDNGKLIKVGSENDDILFKAYPLYSEDINNDGVTEVGGMYIPKGWKNAAFAEIPFIYVYADYNIDGTKRTIEERYTNRAQHFYITIPPEWYGKATIKKLNNGIRLVSNEDEKTLFQVKWINKEFYNPNTTKLKERFNTVFYTDTEEDTIIPTDNFHLLEDEYFRE